jgi:hypothetical protein
VNATLLNDELDGLFHRLCEQTATAADVSRLESLALADEGVYRAYLNYFSLHGSLCLSHSEVAIGTLPMGIAAVMPRDRSSWIQRRHLARLAAGLVVTGLVGYFLILVMALMTSQAWRGDRRPNLIPADATVASNPIASLDATGCTWKTGTFSPGKQLLPQTTLWLERGVASLNFVDGPRVLVEGPAEFALQSSNLIQLAHGSLVAQVPAHAIGFTVETPTVTVIDLGTEFGVDADAKGDTEIEVFEGKVRYEARRADDELAKETNTAVLVAGEAVRVESSATTGAVAARAIEPGSKPFTRPRGSLAQRPIRVHGALASSQTFDVRSVNLIINGAGLHGACHTNVPNGSMWHSKLGEIQDEFVLFDLGMPHRLHSMKVWNYNEQGFEQRRGVALADIYLSATGKGSPLSDPDAWKLLIADRQFNPADGQENYATPDVIAFDSAEARYVALVIKANQEGPQDKPVRDACVGLSEVQFFGTRVAPSVQARRPPKSE